jgi:hypothetical protein
MSSHRGDDSAVAPGATVPAIPLPATDGTMVTLAARLGRTLVMVTRTALGRAGPIRCTGTRFPGAHGSTPELEGFRDHHAHFVTCGVRLFDLSRQTTEYQRELAVRLALPFPILRWGGTLRRRARIAELHHRRRDLSRAAHSCIAKRGRRAGVPPGGRSRRPCCRIAASSRTLTGKFTLQALVLGILDRVAEPVERFLEIVGQERHADEVVIGTMGMLGAGGGQRLVELVRTERASTDPRQRD